MTAQCANSTHCYGCREASQLASSLAAAQKNAREGWAAANAAVDRAIAAESRCVAAEQETARLRESGQQAVTLRERAIQQEHTLRVAAEQEIARLNAKLDAGLTPRQEEAIKEYVVNATEALIAETARAQKAEQASEQRVRALEAALRQAHACATIRPDGSCDGCVVSAALAPPPDATTG